MNGEYRGNSDIGKLMHDFNCTDADDMNFELLASRTKYLKEDPKGVSEMCKAMEDMRNESRTEGVWIGEIKILAGLVKDKVLAVNDAAKRADSLIMILR